MPIVEVNLPKMGEGIMEATVLTWLKKPGDVVSADDFILEVATDKIDTEVPTPISGKIHKLLVQEGEIAEIGKPICLMESDEAAENDSAESLIDPTEIFNELSVNMADLEQINHLTQISTSSNQFTNSNESNPWISPLIKQICIQENISLKELNSIKGTGIENRITKKDVLDYIDRRNGSVLPKGSAVPIQKIPRLEGDQEIPMDRQRKMIAERMVDSKRISPHVSSVIETNVSRLVKWRESIKKEFIQNHQQNFTFTPVLVKATAEALKAYPGMNISVEGEMIIQHSIINIGVAVALPNGNLIVPVIKNADQKSLSELAFELNDLSNRARENKLSPAELQGGTFTISNIGAFGNIMGTPIIVQPQVGILAFGTIEKKPIVVSDENGDQIIIASKMFITHSYDHRVVDGSLGGMFLKFVSDYLEKEDFNL